MSVKILREQTLLKYPSASSGKMATIEARRTSLPGLFVHRTPNGDGSGLHQDAWSISHSSGYYLVAGIRWKDLRRALSLLEGVNWDRPSQDLSNDPDAPMAVSSARLYGWAT